MPGRHSIYPEGTVTVPVPLVISKQEADALWSIAPSRAAAVRKVVQNRVDAINAVETLTVPDDIASIYDAAAAAVRALSIVNALEDTDQAEKLIEYVAACSKKAGRLKRGGTLAVS